MNNLESQINKTLNNYESAAIAFSGGIDSTLLALCSQKFINGKVIAININSPFSTASELQFAKKWCMENLIDLIIIEENPLNDVKVKNNPIDRCYYCKKILMSLIIEAAAKHGIKNIFDGTNLDDLTDYRPGIKASDELGILHPFIDAKFGKEEIRKLAKSYNLSIWDKPSSACLASRIPYNTQITETDLRIIEKAENYMHELGFLLCRVRKFDNTAKIEIPKSRIENFILDYEKIVEHLKSIGFKHALLDLEGYRQGSLNP